jgi:hypothetical protein
MSTFSKRAHKKIERSPMSQLASSQIKLSVSKDDLQKLAAILDEFDSDCEIFLDDPGDEAEAMRLKRRQRDARCWARRVQRALNPRGKV